MNLHLLRGRVIMHCDSLVGAETGEGESGEGPIVHEPPRRVLTKLPNKQVREVSMKSTKEYK